MSNFLQVSDSKFIINLDQVAWVDTQPNDRYGEPITDSVMVYFTQGNSVLLTGEEAKRFLDTLMRQTAVW